MELPGGLGSVATIDRQTFLDRVWDYESGQHVTFLGYNGSGKTTLKMQLIHAMGDFEGKIGIVDTKPKHPDMDEWATRFKWPVVKSYPFSLSERFRYLGWDKDTFVFRPPHGYDIEKTDEYLEMKIKQFCLQAYHGKPDWIIDCDEMLDWVDLNLKTVMRVLWTRGRSMGVGLWGGTQRPFDVPLYAYNQATHIFLARETDKYNRDRLKNIGGIDSRIVSAIVESLKPYHWLYLQPRQGRACIVGP